VLAAPTDASSAAEWPIAVFQQQHVAPDGTSALVRFTSFKERLWDGHVGAGQRQNVDVALVRQRHIAQLQHAVIFLVENDLQLSST